MDHVREKIPLSTGKKDAKKRWKALCGKKDGREIELEIPVLNMVLRDVFYSVYFAWFGW